VAREVAQILVVVQAQIPDGVVHLGGAVDGRVVGMCEVDQIHAVLLRVHRARLRPLFAVVNHDLVVLAARNQVFPIGRKVDGVDLVRVLAEDLGHFEAAHHGIY